jgi:hypothetical protein
MSSASRSAISTLIPEERSCAGVALRIVPGLMHTVSRFTFESRSGHWSAHRGPREIRFPRFR